GLRGGLDRGIEVAGGRGRERLAGALPADAAERTYGRDADLGGRIVAEHLGERLGGLVIAREAREGVRDVDAHEPRAVKRERDQREPLRRREPLRALVAR